MWLAWFSVLVVLVWFLVGIVVATDGPLRKGCTPGLHWFTGSYPHPGWGISLNNFPFSCEGGYLQAMRSFLWYLLTQEEPMKYKRNSKKCRHSRNISRRHTVCAFYAFRLRRPLPLPPCWWRWQGEGMLIFLRNPRGPSSIFFSTRNDAFLRRLADWEWFINDSYSQQSTPAISKPWRPDSNIDK